ncbi:MAG: glycosyl hydrolase family 5 [Robiginitomaculum sp.]|nr:MAG: glycosyl hydrolase family 5 [Robiginitomaculum sp.]
MRKLAVFTIFGLSLLAMPAQADNLVGDKVVLRALDKVTATTEDYTVNVGEVLKYGSLEVTVHHCEKRPPEETPETFAFLQITDARTDGQGGAIEQAKLFSGWMFASSPALSSLEHPVYDIWVLDCVIPPPPPSLEELLTELENVESR